MLWVLKSRERADVFLGKDKAGNLRFFPIAREACTFPSEQEAQHFAEYLVSSREIVEAWNSRPPELLPIRIDARSIIVDLWERIFCFLGKISLFFLIRKIAEKLRLAYFQSYRFVESWALLWNLMSVVFLFAATSHLQWRITSFILILFGVPRVFEATIYQVNVTFFDEYRSLKESLKDPKKPPYAVRGFRRLVILAIHNYFEILFWFAGFYAYYSCAFKDGHLLRNPSGAFYHSVVTMSTLGYGNIYPANGNWLGYSLTCTQTLIGIFLTIVVFARIIAMIPKPLTMDEYEP